MANSNLNPISHRFQDIATKSDEIAILPTLVWFNTIARVFPMICGMKFSLNKLVLG